MLFVTHLALLCLGRAGLFSLAGVMGVTDVDPFILSLADSAATLTLVSAAGASPGSVGVARIVAPVSVNRAQHRKIS